MHNGARICMFMLMHVCVCDVHLHFEHNLAQNVHARRYGVVNLHGTRVYECIYMHRRIHTFMDACMHTSQLASGIVAHLFVCRMLPLRSPPRAKGCSAPCMCVEGRTLDKSCIVRRASSSLRARCPQAFCMNSGSNVFTSWITHLLIRLGYFAQRRRDPALRCSIAGVFCVCLALRPCAPSCARPPCNG